MRITRLFAFPFLLTLIVSCSENKTPENQPSSPTENATGNNPETPDPKVIAAEQYSLVPGRAGRIKVNMPIDSLRALIPAENLKATQRELEGLKYTAYEIRNAKAGNQLLMLAEESCENKSCKIFRIRVISPKFGTKEGLRVGSTFGEVNKAIKFSYVGIGESDFVALSETDRMAFTLDIAGFPSKPLYKITAADIPDSTKVTSILMF